MKIWVTRTEPDAAATAVRLATLGFDPIIRPLLEVRPLSPAVSLQGVTALAFGSRRSVAAFAALERRRDLPVLTVGDATAAAAREFGFADVRSASGDGHALARLIRTEARGPVLYLSAATPAADLPALVGPAVEVHALPLYETVPTGAGAPEAFDAVLIHSPRAADALAALAPPAEGRLACAISAAAARPLRPLPFAEVRVAAAPNEAELLALLGNQRPRV